MPALAIKYRPKDFSDLVGQVHASQSLKNAIEFKHIAHAYLFYGSRGVGKTTTARILAKALNCEKGPTMEPCGECDHCREITRGNSMDVIEMDAASNRGIDHIRDLRENVRFAPMRARYKIYIIDEVHMLTNESFNALLKTLEEPPSHVVFIMATTEHHKIPETILSRCQTFAFRRFSVPELISRLKHILEHEDISFNEEALYPISEKADGSMRDAISLLDQVAAYAGKETISSEMVNLVLGIPRSELYLDFLEAIRVRDLKKVLLTINRLGEEGQNLKRFLWDFLNILKNTTVLVQTKDPETIDISPTLKGKLEETAAKWDSQELTATFHSLFSLYSQSSIFQNSRSSEIRIALEMAIVELFEKLERPSLSTILGRLERVQHAIDSGEPYREAPATTATKAEPVNTAPQSSPPPVKKPAETPPPAPAQPPINEPTSDVEKVIENPAQSSQEDPEHFLQKEFMAEEVDPEEKDMFK